MYEEVTYEDIMDRMLERVPDSMDKREGSVIYDALAPAAVELMQMYIELDAILQVTFADTSMGEYLERRCGERGITRTPATQSILKGEFTPASIFIPIGTRFSCEDLDYEVVQKLEDGAYEMKCETEGAVGNTIFGQMIPIDYIDGLETCYLTEVLIPGEDEESDDDLRERYFETFDTKPYGGNQKDYIQKTNALPGVGSTKVTPVWKGGGTVLLTILDSNFNAASEALIETVQQEIDPTQDGQGLGIAPIDHIVTVNTAQEVSVNVSTSLSFDEGYSFASLKTTITDVISAYLKEVRTDWANYSQSIVRISQIETRLLSITGVVDIANTKINGAASNLTLGTYEIPVIGGVTNG